MKKTKIIATVGPACESPEMIADFINAGVNVFRLNFSHGTHEEHLNYIKTIRKVTKNLGAYTAILADLQGPKIRTGNFEGQLKANQEVVLSCTTATENEIPVQYKGLANDVKKGDTLLLDDGKIEFRVSGVQGEKIKAKVLIGGLLKPKKGINLATGTITAEVITSKDKKDAEFAIANGVDFLALSFVKDANDINKLRRIVARSKKAGTQIIAKIERHEALLDLDNIIKASDGVMVARGDLGIELPPQKVPIIQKKIIRRALAFGKPCIVATQMLESMIESPRSTRAETSDIANAILDGADATMLSGETSVGKYPLNAVKAMKAIALNTEGWMEQENIYIARRIERDSTQISEAVAMSAVEISKNVRSKYIIAATATGNNARALSKYRPHANIIAVTQSEDVARQLSISWGVEPTLLDYKNNRDMVIKMNDWLKKNKKVKVGDPVTVVSGLIKNEIGGTNLIRIHKID